MPEAVELAVPGMGPAGLWKGPERTHFSGISRIGITLRFTVRSFLLGEYPNANASTFPAEMPGHSVTRNSDGETQSSVNNGVDR
jgi:hypothetical protein